MKVHSLTYSLLPGLLLLSSCQGSYDFKTDAYVKKPVVMSVINPDSLMTVMVYWNKPTNSDKGFEMIAGADVEITEEGNVVFSGQTAADGSAASSAYPSAGKKYGLRVNIDGWPEITASTEIPQPVSIAYTSRIKTDYHNGYILADISAITAPESVNAVWISAEGGYEDGSRDTYYSCLYSMCAFLDQVNAVTDPDDVSLRESNVTYEGGFIRIQRSALRLAVPFTFSFSVWWSKIDWDNWDWENPEAEYATTYLDKAVVQVISPSYEYDKFRRSQYRQDAEMSSPFMTEGLTVYSNIENGVGIFAGYNLTEFVIPVDNPEKEI